jgi:signal peptidase I
MKKKKILYSVIVLLALMTMVIKPKRIFMINYTGSSPRGLYAISKEAASVGDFIVIHSGRLAFNDGIENTFLLKKIAFAGNEAVVINRDHLRVGGKWVFKKHRDAGILYEGVLKDGECIITGTHDRSFDSRYFGPVKIADCTPVRPLFLIDKL